MAWSPARMGIAFALLAAACAAAAAAAKASGSQDGGDGGGGAAAASWPADLDSFQPCVVNQTLTGVRDDASGLSWDPEGAWWLITDKPLAAFKYNMNFSRLLQVVQLSSVLDPEAIAWAGPERLVIAEEMRDVVVIDVPAGQASTRPSAIRSIKLSSMVRRPNKGIEGLVYDATTGGFLMAQEDYPQAVYRLSPNGTYELLFTGDKLGVKDLSDLTCWGPNCNSLLIVSQGSKRIVLSDMSGNILSSLKIKGLSRPEGLALSGNGRLMAVASEPNTFSLYSADPC